MGQLRQQKNNSQRKDATTKDKRATANSTYTQAGVSCFVGQESSKFKVQCFVGYSVVKTPPACSWKPLKASFKKNP